MSVVACRILKDGFEMSADSITVSGDLQFKNKNQKFGKLFEINDIVFGGVGLSQDNALMQLYLETHGIARPDERAVLEFLAEFSDWKKEKTDDANIENEFLIGKGQ